jgi:enoyl-[acyl-carrier protein] reductase I
LVSPTFGSSLRREIYKLKGAFNNFVELLTISPGTIATHAASGLANFDELMKKTEEMPPLKRLPTIEDVGKMAAFLVSDEAQYITGDVFYVDGGLHIMGV